MAHSPPSAQSPGTTVPARLRDAVETVFRTMAQREVRLLRHSRANGAPTAMADLVATHGPVIVASVGFVGRTNGALYLCLSRTLAAQLTGDILGLDATAAERDDVEIVQDAIVELTNVTAGTFKNHLCDRGLSCHLTIPTVLPGPPYQIAEVANTSRWTFDFETRGACFVVEVLCDHTL